MRLIVKITDILTNILLTIACIDLLYILFACGMQVFSRYVLNSSFAWTEETARYAFACMGMLGAPVALRKGMHVNVDILTRKLSGKNLRIQKIIIFSFIFAVSFILLKEGLVLFYGMKDILSPVVRIPMSYVYFSVPVCGITSMWICLVELLGIFTENRMKEN